MKAGGGRLKKEAKERIARCEKERRCVACMELFAPPDETSIRGCHIRCYHATYRAIRSGKFTEVQRVREGKLLEPKNRGRKPSNPVSIEVSE